jgi:hypothetical protein
LGQYYENLVILISHLVGDCNRKLGCTDDAGVATLPEVDGSSVVHAAVPDGDYRKAELSTGKKLPITVILAMRTLHLVNPLILPGGHQLFIERPKGKTIAPDQRSILILGY